MKGEEKMSDREFGELLGGMVLIIIYLASIAFSLAISIFFYFCYWKIYKMAGYEGWEAIIPFYKTYILSEITLGKGIWFLLTFVPCLNIAVGLLMMYRLGMAFQKSAAFSVGLIFLPIVFVPILAFSKNNTYFKLSPFTL